MLHNNDYYEILKTVMYSGNQKISKNPVFYNLEDIVYFFLAFNCENDIYRYTQVCLCPIRSILETSQCFESPKSGLFLHS